jgi:hypothetical protein
MSRLLAVTARELRERWLFFPAGLVLGFVPLVLPAFGLPSKDAPAVGLMFSVVLAAAAAVIMGATMLARDTASGRLGFLFTRPVSWPAIWAGKWVAALLLVVVSGFLAFLPTMATRPPMGHGGSWLRTLLDAQGSVYMLVLIALFVGIANFGATAFRSRAPWVALDLLLLLAALWATRRYVAPLWGYGALSGGWWFSLLLSPVAVGLVVGSVAQVAFGRTDIRRAHRALSLVFWAVVLATLAAAAGYLHWIRVAGPRDLRAFAVTSGPDGHWVYVEGQNARGAGFPHACLVDATTGRYWVRPDPEPGDHVWGAGAVFSPDGRLVLLPHGGADGGTALTLIDLAGSTIRLREVALESSPPPTWDAAFALSPPADLVLMAHRSGVSLFALPSGRRVATTTVTPGFVPSTARFLSPTAARVWLVAGGQAPAKGQPGAVRVVDLASDGASRATSFTLGSPIGRAADLFRAVVARADGARIVTIDGGLVLRDGATGAVLATLAEENGLESAGFLADRRVVATEGGVGSGPGFRPSSSGPRLRAFSADGVPLGEMPLDLPPSGLAVGSEVSPGRVLVSSFRTPFLPGESLLVDVDARQVVERLDGLRPALGSLGGIPPMASPGHPSAVQYFRDAEGRVLRIDFATGNRTVVAGPGAPAGGRLSLR